MADTKTPPADKMGEVITKLAEFRNTLPEKEQAMMDSLVATATGETDGAGGDEVPSEPELAGFATKLEDYRDTLPEDERILVDGIVVASGAVEEEVTGHAWYAAWSATDAHWLRDTYKNACFRRPGQQYISYTPVWWSFGSLTTYRCYDWR